MIESHEQQRSPILQTRHRELWSILSLIARQLEVHGLRELRSKQWLSEHAAWEQYDLRSARLLGTIQRP